MPAPISLDATSMMLVGRVPPSTQVLDAATYLSARRELSQRTVMTVSSGSRTQLSSEELEPLVGPALKESVAGSKMAVRVSSRLPISTRPSGSTAHAASPTRVQPDGGATSVHVSVVGS